MTQDIPQWLAEIKTLKQQLATAQQEREEAYTSAANWRRLYETEAQQRRTEANLTQRTIEGLKAEIQQLQGLPQLGLADSPLSQTIQAEVDKLRTIDALRQKLIEVLTERDHLIQALRLEQSNHAQTRKSLTTALGDTIDLLSKERKEHSRAIAPESSQNQED